MSAQPDLGLLGQSMLIGLTIAAPVGPIGVLTIQRTLRWGARAGLATGLGAAVVDALYGAIGAFGVTAVIDGLIQARRPLALVGAVFLLWLAWRSWRAAPALAATTRAAAPRLWSCFASTLVLTLSNPATILSFIAIFGALGARLQTSSPGLMVLGVLAGSALWWLLLCGVVAHLRERFDALWRSAVNRLSALLLAAFALWQLLGLVLA